MESFRGNVPIGAWNFMVFDFNDVTLIYSFMEPKG